MKAHHAAALALVGWYFMLPSARFSHLPTGETVVHMNIKAPLSRWQIAGRFDSIMKCNQHSDELRKMQRETENPNASVVERRNEETLNETMLAEHRCIPTDDPRLKGNKDIRDF